MAKATIIFRVDCQTGESWREREREKRREGNGRGGEKEKVSERERRRERESVLEICRGIPLSL